ncbi:MAG TPA: phosphomannomutase/phosphoglucomutase [Methylomirabilota bacterium]|jgi:phosphomannomutase/phosphoglucomutase|nr:phosphomannomutase/phosphoglucomutase [Methylomirabilota bacterium]
MLNPHIFRAYDVRGRVGSDLNAEIFRQVGRAYATLIRRNGGRTIAVGQDNRESSAELKAGFVEGARAAGVNVVDVGVVTTPILYFAVAHWTLDGGANITGSHNPVEYNGVKMVHPGAAPLSEDEIQSLRAMIERHDVESGAGTLTSRSPRDDYFDTVARIVHPARPLKVVADAGNGIAGVYGPPLLRRLGVEVIELHCESDGRFPNHLPDPEDPANVVDLQQKVLEVGADLGLAWDGDADRVGVIDERGRRHEADLVLALLARDLLGRHPGAKIVFDVKCSQVLVDDIRKHGGVPVMWKTGHSHLKRKMREDKILLGGEVSGHIFFAEGYYGVDDGILAACKVVELVSRHAQPVSTLFDALPHLHATPELKAPCPDAEKFRVIEELARELKQRYETIDIDGARVLFPGGGWGLVRASNTNPYLTLRFEAKTEREIEDMKRVIYDALRRYPFVTLPS